MTTDFRIDLSWSTAAHGSPAIRQTSALMNISLGQNVATRFEDAWSKSIQQSVYVSAYPLALWLASSWWRLRWEPLPYKGQPDSSWRMAHEMPSAGHGYLWPLLTFASDGEMIEVNCRPSNPLNAEPIHYVADFRTLVEAQNFERAVTDFIDLVVARLDAVGVPRTELQSLWEDIRSERNDPQQTVGRILEARLGYEPDDAPDGLILRLLALSENAGSSTAQELAPVCAGRHGAEILERIEGLAQSEGAQARFHLPNVSQFPTEDGTPWQRGRQLARDVRTLLGLGSAPLSDADLANLLQITGDVFQRGSLTAPSEPVGLGVRSGRNGDGDVKLIFRKRNRPGRRFEAARFMADQLSTPAQERWLAITDTATARQKLQRAFAAEFLSPIASLDEYLEQDYSPEAVEAAGEHFGVSELAIKSHLANNGRLAFDTLSV